MARQKPKAKSRRKLLAENKDLVLTVGRLKIGHDNLTQQRDEAVSSKERLSTQLAESKANVDRIARNLEQSLGEARGRIAELARELFMQLRISMRQQGMSFEDIDRILRERGLNDDMSNTFGRRACDCPSCRNGMTDHRY